MSVREELSPQELEYYLLAEVGEEVECRVCGEWFTKPSRSRRVCDSCYEGWLRLYGCQPKGWVFRHSANQGQLLANANPL